MSVGSEKIEQTRILLESGTNEVEMLEFFVGDQHFAVNVAKVQTLVQYAKENVTDMPEMHSQVKHMVKIHEQILPMLKLSDILNIEANATIDRKIVVLLQFNNIRVAVLVDGVVSIHRMSWNDFTPISHYISKNSDTSVLGSFRDRERDILILDFEKIMASFFPDTNIEAVYDNTSTDLKENKTRETIKVINVDDSSTIRGLIKKTLTTSGFVKIQNFENGLEAYNYILKEKESGKTIEEIADIFILDIEMPQMDGLTLCRKLKQELNATTPIIMFSSLIDAQMIEKCKHVGADDQITKPQIVQLVSLMDKLLKIEV